MESLSSHNRLVAYHTLSQILRACDMIIQWNKDVHTVDDYLSSSDGMQKMAANCMLLESLGEGVKKIDRL